MHAGDTPNLKEAKTLLYEFSMVGDSKNAAVQESGYGYKLTCRHRESTSGLPPITDVRPPMSAFEPFRPALHPAPDEPTGGVFVVNDPGCAKTKFERF